MKNFIKAISAALCATMVCTAAISCSGKKNDDVDPQGRRILKFEFLKAGFGTEVYEKLADAYMAEHKDVLIKLIPNVNVNSTTATKLEANNNVADLYSIRDMGEIRRYAVKGWVEDLTPLLDEKVSEDLTLRDSLTGNAVGVSSYQGKLYAVPEYTSISGFCYNKGMFEQYGWKIPETTEELESLCKQIKKDTNGTVAPIVYCGAAADGYLYIPTNNWISMYEGIDNLNKFYAMDSAEVYNPANSQGKLHALETLKKFYFDNDGEYCMDKSMGKSHITAQTDLIQGKVAMMANGSWLQNEMKSVLAKNPTFRLGMFKFPEYSENGVIKHADGYTTEDGKSVLNCGFGANYFVPKNAANKADALDFLKFINRPDICVLYTQYSNAVRPLTYNLDSSTADYKDMSEYGKDIISIAQNNYMYQPAQTSPMALTGRLGLWPASGGYWYFKMYNDPTQFTPAACLEKDYEYAKTNWDEFLKGTT